MRFTIKGHLENKSQGRGGDPNPFVTWEGVGNLICHGSKLSEKLFPG